MQDEGDLLMTRVLRLALVAVLVLLATGCVPDAVRGEKITVTAYFADSAGLFVGNDVGVLGVPIGKVTDIEPDGDRVKVTMEIDADRAVPADAGAVVVARSVATDRYVELTPVYDGGEKLTDGAEIDVERTASPVDFDEDSLSGRGLSIISRIADRWWVDVSDGTRVNAELQLAQA